MDIDQMVGKIYASEPQSAVSTLSQKSHTSHASQDISLEFIRAMTTDAGTLNIAHASLLSSELTSKPQIPPYKEASLRSASPESLHNVRAGSSFKYDRDTSPISCLEDDLNKLFMDGEPIAWRARSSRSHSTKVRDSEESSRRNSSFAGVRSLRSGEIPAKLLLMSSQSGRSSALSRTPAGSILRSRRSTEQFAHVRTGGSYGATNEYPQQYDNVSDGEYVEPNTSSAYSTFSSRNYPHQITEAEMTRRTFRVLNCLKINRPDCFFMQKNSARSILAFSEEDTMPLNLHQEAHKPSPSQAVLVLKVDFPDQLKQCTYNMVYFGFYSLFGGLVEDDREFMLSDTDCLTVSEVEPFCIAMARHVLYITQSYNKYVSPSVSIERLRSSRSITVPFTKCVQVFKKELKTLRLTTLPRQDSVYRHQFPGTSSMSNSTASLKSTDEILSHCSMLHSLHEKKKARQAEIDRKRAEDETLSCTFRPELNLKSIELSTRKRIINETYSVQDTVEKDIENYTVKARSLNELDDYTKILNNYLHELKVYAMNQRILAHFPDDHVIWDDAYHALRANVSRKYREEVMDNFKERMAAEVRSKDAEKLPKTRYKLNYKPGESILDVAAQPSVCYYNSHLRAVKDDEPYRFNERQRRNTALVSQGILRPEFAGMTDETFKSLPVASKMHTVVADRQAEYRDRMEKADQRVAAVRPYVRGGGDVTSLIGEAGMGEVVQATLNTKMGEAKNMDSDPLVASPVLLSSLTRCLETIRTITQQENLASP